MEVDSKYLSVGDVNIVNGYILNNPFRYGFEKTKAVNWILANENLVKNVLKTVMIVGVGESIEECYSYLFEYFTGKDKAYTPLYYKNEDFPDLKGVRGYVFGNIQYAVRQYQKKTKKENLNAKGYLTGFTGDSDVPRSGYSVSDNVARTEDTYTLVEHSYQQEVFDKLVDLFKEYLKFKHYKVFDYRKFVYSAFCKSDFEDLESKTISVSKYLSEPTELIEMLYTDLRSGYKAQDPNVLEFYKLLKIYFELDKDYIPMGVI